MTLDEYQTEAKRTASRDLNAYPEPVRFAYETLMEQCAESGAHKAASDLLRIFDQLIWCLGLAGEVGETLDMLKKHFGHGHPLDREKLCKELGDSRWYGAVLEDSFGFTSSHVARTNIEKLRSRYPAGFTVEASKAKSDEASAARMDLQSAPSFDANGTPVEPLDPCFFCDSEAACSCDEEFWTEGWGM